jgi:hypothetical protein
VSELEGEDKNICMSKMGIPFKHPDRVFKFITVTVFGFDATRTCHCILVFICYALTVRLELSVEAVDLIEKQGCGCSTLLVYRVENVSPAMGRGIDSRNRVWN